jgi:hypothetical protein
MPAVRRSTRKSAGRTPAKFRPDEEEEEEAPLGLPVAEEDEDSEDDEDFEENDEVMPNMHFGLASRAALEAEEGGAVAPAVNIFLINAIVEGLAGLTAVYESFLPGTDRLLVADESSPMVRATSRLSDAVPSFPRALVPSLYRSPTLRVHPCCST